MSKRKESGNYDVGYGKPPRATQFQPGKSGNPGGRPHGSKNYLQQFASAANEKITVNVKGKPRRIPIFQAICMQVLNTAVKGDGPAQRLAFDVAQRIAMDTRPVATTGLDMDDQATVADFMRSVMAYGEKKAKRPKRSKK